MRSRARSGSRSSSGCSAHSAAISAARSAKRRNQRVLVIAEPTFAALHEDVRQELEAEHVAKAISDYDPDRGAFEHYARAREAGEVRNAKRSERTVSRTLRHG